MTANELLQTYPVYTYTPSAGDTIFSVASILYSSYEDPYLSFLKTVNRRYDWSSLQAGASIRYIAKEYIKYFNEIQ